jgi:hypothetical protein
VVGKSLNQRGVGLNADHALLGRGQCVIRGLVDTVIQDKLKRWSQLPHQHLGALHGLLARVVRLHGKERL